MREIKFRAWDKEINKMVFQHDMNGSLVYKDHLFSLNECNVELLRYDTDYSAYIKCNAELMKYTGLKDVNGKEIYEGDIVELNITYWNNCNKEYVEEEREFIGEITDFRGLGWSIRYKDKDNNIDYPMMWLLGKDYTIEVKGNIYENQELLG